MKTLKFISLVAISAVMIYSCKPFTEEGIDLPNPPSASFSWEYLSGDDNRVVFESTSTDGFIHFWDFGNGMTSNALIDTVFYPQAGAYDISYSVSNDGGTGSAMETVIIAQTVELPCDGILELLTGCDNQKTWIFAQDEGAIMVGENPYGGEWHTSPEAGLVPEQYADSYQFTADGEFMYSNEGLTINPWADWTPEAFEPVDATFSLSPGTGTSGEDQFIISTCSFMGTRDAGPVYDIIELTETRLVIHGAVQDQTCAQGAGYFTFIFEAQ
jgi:PKD repeat protein